jgi:hypothetical protein
MAGRVVFTALMGPHEHLTEQKVARSTTVRFICFSDDPELSSTTWEIVHTPPLFPNDSRRSQRDIKIRGHEALADFDEWLYIDNTVKLLVDPNQIFDSWLDGSDWTQFDHDSYDSTWKDFDVNRTKEADSIERIDEQLYDYSLHYPAALDARPPWNGMFARRITDHTIRHQKIWFDHVLRYSSRDQLSSTVAAALSGLPIRRLVGSNRRSPWHTWPHRDGETEASKAVRVKRTTGFRELAEELRDERERHEHTRQELTTSQHSLQKLSDRRWFGLSGAFRRAQAARKELRRKRRQAKKRR